MKKFIISLLLFSFMIFWACMPTDPDQPTDESINAASLVLSKMVAVGNSLTAGVQSTGLLQDFQMHSYPYLIAQQMGQAANFQQPLVASPGLGSPLGMTPQMYDPATGAITQDVLPITDPAQLAGYLLNPYLPRAYDNMGIPGFDLNDALNTTSGGMADLVLRNPDFGNTTQLQQAMGLSPTLLILWLGNNDVLGAALDGGDLTQITSAADFTSRLTQVLTYIRVDQGYANAIVMANIPTVSDIPYVNMLDGIFVDPGTGTAIPMLFDLTFQPIDFGFGLMLPLITEETGVTHVTLPGALAYQAGLGVPDSAYIVNNFGYPPGMAASIVAGLVAEGITPTGLPIPGDMTITATEEAAIAAAVTGFNTIIDQLAAAFSVQAVMDANTALATLNSTGIDGFTGHYVYMNPSGTAFSLDGVHPNNAGYAIIANEFIKVINTYLGQNLPLLTTAQYGGQYTGALPKITTAKAIEGVRELFRKN
ncbi:hypothetical protein ACFLSX_03195 [Calditrichota bacterium]